MTNERCDFYFILFFVQRREISLNTTKIIPIKPNPNIIKNNIYDLQFLNKSKINKKNKKKEIKR